MLSAADRFSNLCPITAPECAYFTGDIDMQPLSARKTQRGSLAVPVQCADQTICNLFFVALDGRHGFLESLSGGEHTACSNFVDATRVIIGESLLSTLALAARPEHRLEYIVAAYLPENMPLVADAIWQRWPFLEYVFAPDGNNPYLRPKTRKLMPPRGTDWWHLHMWQQQVAL